MSTFDEYLDQRRCDVHLLATKVNTGVIRNPCDESVIRAAKDAKPINWSAKWGQQVSTNDQPLIPIAESIARDSKAQGLFACMLEGFAALDSAVVSRE